MQLVTLRAGRWSASAVAIALLLAPGCGDSGQIRVYQDAAFVDTASGETDVDEGSVDADGAEGCAVPEPAACSTDNSAPGCCVVGERCVPALNGDNQCEPAGELLDGQSCGTAGSDACAAGLLCAESDSGSLACVRPCDESSAACPAGFSCDGSLQLVGRTLAICKADE
jgi:hypothetical protein